jgi:hypothetical protein
LKAHFGGDAQPKPRGILECGLGMRSTEDPNDRAADEARHWRERAAEAQLIAESTGDPETKQELLEISAMYRSMAGAAGQKTTPCS